MFISLNTLLWTHVHVVEYLLNNFDFTRKTEFEIHSEISWKFAQIFPCCPKKERMVTQSLTKLSLGCGMLVEKKI